jgi:hypothetical protein
MKNQDELTVQAAALLTLGEKVLATEDNTKQQKLTVNETQFHDWRISSLSFLSRVFGVTSTYHQSFWTEVTQATPSRTRRGLGILEGAKREIASGNWLETTVGSVTADVLADMLRIARLQFDSGSLAAATSVGGAILEKQLRTICLAHEIPLYNESQNKNMAKRGLQLASEAYKKKIFSRQENKSILSWLELADTAISAPKTLDTKKVKEMLNGINLLISKTKY